MNLTTKILIFVFALFIVGTAGFVIYKEHELSVRQDAIEKNLVAQKEIADNILRSMDQYTTKQDLDAFAKASNINLDVIKQDLEKLNASVVAINVAKANSQGQIVTNVSSTTINPGDNPNPPAKDTDPYGYQANQQVLSLNEEFGSSGVPIGDVGFSAWKDKPWNINIKPRQYTATTVIGTDENQRIYTYNKLSINVDNKDYDVKLTQGQTQQIYPEAKFSWWNPRLYMGFDGGINVSKVRGEAAPSLNLQLMSYGRYLTQPDFSILEVGVGYQLDSKRPSVIVTPFSYNIGKPLPLLNNTYIGPSISISTAGDISVMAGIRVGL